MDNVFQHISKTNNIYCIVCSQFYEHLVPVSWFHILQYKFRYKYSCPSSLCFPFFEKLLISFTSCNMLIVICHLEIIMPPKFPATKSTSHNISHYYDASLTFHVMELGSEYLTHIAVDMCDNIFRQYGNVSGFSYLSF